jgi:hypothetical protein
VVLDYFGGIDYDMDLISININLELDWCKRTKGALYGLRTNDDESDDNDTPD